MNAKSGSSGPGNEGSSVGRNPFRVRTKRERVIELATGGQLTVVQIALRVNATAGFVRSTLKLAGIVAKPDGPRWRRGPYRDIP